jgi:hypothetical protein
MAVESQGTAFEIGTGTGAAKNITGVTLGAITKITSAAHGLAVGDVVTFASVGGTTVLNGQTAMVTAVETGAFYVNINTVGAGAYTSGGTATPVEWSEVGLVTDWDGPGGSASVIDTTHLKSAAREKLIGLMDEGQISLTVNWDSDDTGQEACRIARSTRSKKDFRISYMNGAVQTFEGYVLGFPSSGGVDGKVEGNITIEITGPVATA